MKWMKRALLALAVLVAAVLLAGVAIYLTNRDPHISHATQATSPAPDPLENRHSVRALEEMRRFS